MIPNTINEFPLWTFVFADLHPHLIAMPFGLLVVGLALNWVARGGSWKLEAGSPKLEGGLPAEQVWKLEEEHAEAGAQQTENEGAAPPLPASPRPRVPVSPCFLVSLSTCLLIALSLGALGVINTWDLPTYALLVAGACIVAGWRARRWLGAAGGLLLAAVISALAVAAYWPFYAHYETQVGQGAGSLVGRFLGWVRAGSPLDDWLVIWGFFLLLAACYVVVVWRQGSGGAEEQGSRGAEEQEGEVVITAPGEHSPSGAVILSSSALAPAPRFGAGAGEGDCEAASAGEDFTPDDAESADVFDFSAPFAFSAVISSADGGEGAELGDPQWTATPAAMDPFDSRSVSQTPTPPYNRLRLIALLALLGGLALLAGAGRPTAAIAALPLCLALPLAFRRKSSAGEATVALLLALGLSIIAGTELIYLRDFLAGGDWYRMNTLFKFSVPAWLFLALAGGVMLPVVWSAAGRAPGWIGAPIRVVLGVMLAGGLVFLVAGIPARVEDRFPGARPPLGTLDGTAYMTVGRYIWPGGEHIIQLAPEREAIRWLLDNVTGTPVIAEAPAGGYEVEGLPVGYDYYRAGGLRVASLTGLPTFVGQHQNEQRPGDQVDRRFDQGKEFFTTTNLARARELMETLRVGYIYVGQLERLLFSVDALRKFDAMAEMGDLEVVYHNPDVTIYRVTR